MAEIPHTFVEQTTTQTHTGDTMFTDIPGASIASGSFTTGRKYLLIFSCQSSIDGSTINFFNSCFHGSTEFPNAQRQLEAASSDVKYPYTWFTVWTAVASEGVKMIHAVSSSGGTVSSDQITLKSIEISEDLTEGTDWYFNERTASDSLSTTWTATNPTVTVSANGTDDWLVIAVSDIRPGATNVNFLTRLNLDDTTLTPVCSQEGEELNKNQYIQFLSRVYTPSSGSRVFEAEASNESGSTGTREHGSIFAMNLNKFDVHSFTRVAGPTALDTNDSLVTSPTQIATTTIVPSASTDVFSMAFWVYDPGGTGRNTKSRMQLANADQPPTQTSDAYDFMRGWDADDQHTMAVFIVDTLSASTAIDLDASANAAGDSLDAFVLAFTMELAAGGSPTTRAKMIGGGVTVGGGTNHGIIG